MKKLTLAAAIAAATVQLYAAKVVNVSARLSKGGDADVSDVTARCEVKPGLEYDPAACARDVKALRDSGEYEDFTVEAKHVADGIDVTYLITPKPRYLGPLNCKGNEYWNASKIAKFADLKDGYAYGADSTSGVKIDAVTGDAVKYYVCVQSLDAKKGKEVYYNVSASLDGAGSSALDMPQDERSGIVFRNFRFEPTADR